MDKLEFNKTASKNHKPKIQFDPLEYVKYLDGMDLTHDEAKDVLSALWDMMVQFVDLGLKIDTGLNNNPASRQKTLPVMKMDSKNVKEKRT